MQKKEMIGTPAPNREKRNRDLLFLKTGINMKINIKSNFLLICDLLLKQHPPDVCVVIDFLMSYALASSSGLL